VNKQMRYSTWLGVIVLFMGIWIALTALDIHQKRRVYDQQIWMRKHLQKKVGLTDLAITSAARYLRHYSLTDMTTPFQDYPVSLDHFPAGFVFSAPNPANTPTPIVFRRYDKLASDPGNNN